MQDLKATTARAWQLAKFDGLGNARFVKVEMPRPKPDEVLLKIHAVSLYHGDILIAEGTHGGPIPNPLIPGSDLAGTIVAKGEIVSSDWNIGDRVSSHIFTEHVEGVLDKTRLMSAVGAFAQGVLVEYKAVPERALVRIPDYLTFVEASTLPTAGVGAFTALRGGLTPIGAGDHVLLIGTGGVSTIALQLAVANGAHPIVISTSAAKLEQMKALGARHTILYQRGQDWAQEVTSVTNGRGVDIVLDIGGKNTLGRSVKSLRNGGTVVLMGNVADHSDEEPQTDQGVGSLIYKTANLRTVLVGAKSDFDTLMHVLDQCKIKPVVDRVFAFEEFNEALFYLSKQEHVGKVVIRVADH